MDELAAQNPQSIQEMFSVISKRYDLANSILSFGVHHLWKKTLISKSDLKPDHRVLDCATGTGDLAFLFEKKLGGSGQVIGTDFCESMLEVARQKAKSKSSKANFETADVMNLPFQDAEFNVASISFGIRNVQDTSKAISELGRVVKPGGRVLILEFGQPKSIFIQRAYEFYSKTILPRVGGWISGQPKAYQYLQTSSAAYPCGDEFLAIARKTGRFDRMRWIRFQSGIAYLYILERPKNSSQNR
jgi:demethylmenaquinone methyltransferase/2-methoxy-6-polyprenyl-1,4-benzoquinol methylase